MIQELYLPRYNDTDYFVELTANVKTETMGKRRIVVPVARDICKFVECLQVKNLENDFFRISGSENLEIRAKIARFNEKLFRFKKVFR